MLILQGVEKNRHLSDDVLWIAERAAAFAEAHGTELAGPWVHVLEEMVVDGFVVADAESASGQRLVSPLGGCDRLEFSEDVLISNAGDVFEDAGVGIAVRICYGVVITGISVVFHTFPGECADALPQEVFADPIRENPRPYRQ